MDKKMSDEDFFAYSQADQARSPDVSRFVSKTQPQKSDLEYMYWILFHWDLGNSEPFSIHNKSLFGEEIPDTWYSFKLRDDLRLKKIYFRMLNGEYSVFCKVEKGRKNVFSFTAIPFYEMPTAESVIVSSLLYCRNLKVESEEGFGELER